MPETKQVPQAFEIRRIGHISLPLKSLSATLKLVIAGREHFVTELIKELSFRSSSWNLGHMKGPN